MRTLFNILSLATLFLLTGCQQKNAAGVPLSFYIVSEEKIDGGQFIDTPDFPKLGYIHATPDLIITKLESVDSGSPSPSIMLDKDEKVVSSNSVPTLSILLNSDDAKKFSSLTEQAVGKRLLTMLGDKPLIAPRVPSPISTPKIQLILSEQTDQKKIENELKQLVH